MSEGERSYGCGWCRVRIEQALAAARKAALEEAARECDGLAREADEVHDAHAAVWSEEVARRIRALGDQR